MGPGPDRTRDPLDLHSDKNISQQVNMIMHNIVLLDFSLTVKAATLIFISGCGSAISSAKEEKSGFIYNLVNN